MRVSSVQAVVVASAFTMLGCLGTAPSTPDTSFPVEPDSRVAVADTGPSAGDTAGELGPDLGADAADAGDLEKPYHPGRLSTQKGSWTLNPTLSKRLSRASNGA